MVYSLTIHIRTCMSQYAGMRMCTSVCISYMCMMSGENNLDAWRVCVQIDVFFRLYMSLRIFIFLLLHQQYPVHWTRSLRFKLYPLADLFISMQTLFLRQSFSHAAISLQRVFTHTFPRLSIEQGPRYHLYK